MHERQYLADPKCPEFAFVSCPASSLYSTSAPDYTSSSSQHVWTSYIITKRCWKTASKRTCNIQNNEKEEKWQYLPWERAAKKSLTGKRKEKKTFPEIHQNRANFSYGAWCLLHPYSQAMSHLGNAPQSHFIIWKE